MTNDDELTPGVYIIVGITIGVIVTLISIFTFPALFPAFMAAPDYTGPENILEANDALNSTDWYVMNADFNSTRFIGVTNTSADGTNMFRFMVSDMSGVDHIATVIKSPRSRPRVYIDGEYTERTY